MNPNIPIQCAFSRRVLWHLLLIAIAALLPMTQASAAHDHDHLFVTIEDYLGYDEEDGMTAIIVSTSRASYRVRLHGHLRTLSRHVGKEGRISVDGDRWTHFAVSGHGGSLRIHSVRGAN